MCPELWAGQLAAVRGVFRGQVSTAFNPDGPDILPPGLLTDDACGRRQLGIVRACTRPTCAAVSAAAWVHDLDFIGVDCYFIPPLPPWQGPGKLQPTDVHPPLPWQVMHAEMPCVV